MAGLGFSAIVVLQVVLSISGEYLRQRLMLRWRGGLTDQALSAWVKSKAYWHLRPGLSPKAIDNPDQRVAEDCRLFIDKMLMLSLDLIENCVSIVSYVAILWGLTNFVLTFSVMGTEIGVSHYLVWLAFVYVGISTFITHGLGRQLRQLYFAQEKREADFRYALVQLRDNAHEIAHSGGEIAEERRLAERFDGIRHNWYGLIRREAILNLFRRPYYYTVMRITVFLSLPAFFAGFVTFGGLMQLARAFGSVTQTLSWFIFKYKSLAEIAAVAERLDELFHTTRDPEPMPETRQAIIHSRSDDGALHVRGLTLSTPQARMLDPIPDFTVKPGTSTWITVRSGIEKSTLLSALSGLWRYGEGEIQTPDASIIFLPQKPYLLPEGLVHAACYPHDPRDVDHDRLRSVLEQVGLRHRLPLLETPGPAALEGLSMGERQRLAMARVLINRPDWVILDEATSALDATSEAELLALIRSTLPDATIICVSHDTPHALAPYAIWQIGPTQSDKRKTA